jgi:phosphonate transport system substrate-binding protein
VALRIEDAAAGSAVLRPARNALAEYHAALFVRSDSPIHAVPQLAGSRVAWVDPTSSAGYVVPRLHLRASGVDPDGFFGDQRFFRNHARVARAVLRGEVDVGATYATSRPGDATIVDAGWTRIGARNDELRVLALAGPIPSDVIVVAHMPREIAAEVTASLEQLRSPTVRSLFGADQLEHVPSRHFEPLRRLVAAAPGKPAHAR